MLQQPSLLHLPVDARFKYAAYYKACNAQHGFTNMQLLIVDVAKTGSEVIVFEKHSNQSVSYTFSCTDNTMDKRRIPSTWADCLGNLIARDEFIVAVTQLLVQACKALRCRCAEMLIQDQLCQCNCSTCWSNPFSGMGTRSRANVGLWTSRQRHKLNFCTKAFFAYHTWYVQKHLRCVVLTQSDRGWVLPFAAQSAAANLEMSQWHGVWYQAESKTGSPCRTEQHHAQE